MNATNGRKRPIETEMPGHVLAPDVKSVAEAVKVKEPVFMDTVTGKVYLTGKALDIIDKAKAAAHVSKPGLTVACRGSCVAT